MSYSKPEPVTLTKQHFSIQNLNNIQEIQFGQKMMFSSEPNRHHTRQVRKILMPEGTTEADERYFDGHAHEYMVTDEFGDVWLVVELMSTQDAGLTTYNGQNATCEIETLSATTSNHTYSGSGYVALRNDLFNVSPGYYNTVARFRSVMNVRVLTPYSRILTLDLNYQASPGLWHDLCYVYVQEYLNVSDRNGRPFAPCVKLYPEELAKLDKAFAEGGNTESIVDAFVAAALQTRGVGVLRKNTATDEPNHKRTVEEQEQYQDQYQDQELKQELKRKKK